MEYRVEIKGESEGGYHLDIDQVIRATSALEALTGFGVPIELITVEYGQAEAVDDGYWSASASLVK